MTVVKWLRRFTATGKLNNSYDQSGRPSVSDLIKEEIILKSIEDPFYSAAGIVKELNLDTSLLTVNKREAGLWTRNAAKT